MPPVQNNDKSNPILAWVEADPAGWRPFAYGEFCDIGIAANAIGRMTIRTVYAPFMWTKTTHTIIGNIDDPETSGLYNDGQYLVSWKDEHAFYVNQPVPANTVWGPHKEGQFPSMEFPVFFPANHSVTIELTNIYLRTLTPEADTYRIYIVIKGMHYWGSLKPPDGLLDASRGVQSLR